MKFNLIFLLFGLFLISCSSEYAVEDELYAYLEDEFSKQSLDLEAALDTLEYLYLDQELLKSTSGESYRQYYQTNIDVGMLLYLQDYYLREVMVKIDLSHYKLERCALRKFDGETYDASKFGQISNKIDTQTKKTGQISSGTVAKAHLDALSSEDFEHPFYRANVLLSLQNLYFNLYVRKDGQYLREIPKKIESDSLY